MTAWNTQSERPNRLAAFEAMVGTPRFAAEYRPLLAAVVALRGACSEDAIAAIVPGARRRRRLDDLAGAQLLERGGSDPVSWSLVEPALFAHLDLDASWAKAIAGARASVARWMLIGLAGHWDFDDATVLRAALDLPSHLRTSGAASGFLVDSVGAWGDELQAWALARSPSLPPRP